MKCHNLNLRKNVLKELTPNQNAIQNYCSSNKQEKKYNNRLMEQNSDDKIKEDDSGS